MSQRDRGSELTLATVSRRGGFLLLPIILLLVLVGCVDEDSGRQFANDPQPTSALPTADATRRAPTARPATPQASPVSAEELLQTRGAAGRFYFESDGALWTMAPRADEVNPVFEPAIGTSIRALAASPRGDRVAAVLVRTEDEADVADLVVLAEDGEEVARYDNIGALGPDPNGRVVSLDWSPQGEKLLVALSPGGLVAVQLTGDAEPKLIVSGGVASRPEQAAWSPTGEDVGFLATTEDERASIYVAGVAATPTSPRALLPDDGSRPTIFDWAWLPDGRSLLFSEERDLTSTADLWRINSDGTDRELVASAGSVAPVARIVGAEPSRDGRAVAYLVIVPGDGNDVFDSLWVRDLSTNHGYRIQVPSGTSVTDVWWTDAGLMFRAIPGNQYTSKYNGGPYGLYRVTDGTEASLVHEVASEPLASPAASPAP